MSLAVALEAFAGCAGVYAEVAATTFPSPKVQPEGGGADIALDGGSTLTFNAGIEFGSIKQRFAMGYLRDSISFDGADSTLTGGVLRYDRAIVGLGDRANVRLGFGMDFGSTTNAAMDEGFGTGLLAGVGASYFATWRTPIHVLVGGRFFRSDVPGGTAIATGLTLRAGVSYHFRDPRPDSTIVAPLDSNRELTGLIEDRAEGAGCTTSGRQVGSNFATIEVNCDGRRYEFFQIAEGIMVTCKRQPSRAKCDKEVAEIIRGSKESAPPASKPAAPAAAPPPAAAAAASPPAPPATEPAPAAAPAEAVPAPAPAPAEAPSASAP